MAISINGSTNVISGVAVGGLPDGIVDTDMLAANAVTAVKASPGLGKILQVVATNVTGTSSVSFANAGLADTPATVTITSAAANSKFLISGVINGEANDPDHKIGFVLRRVIAGSGASIAVGDSSGSRSSITFMQNQGFYDEDNSTTPSTSVLSSYLDSPSQAAGTSITYKIDIIGLGESGTYYFGRCVSNTDNASNELMPNYITVMEVAA